jgi:hypothetical protein
MRLDAFRDRPVVGEHAHAHRPQDCAGLCDCHGFGWMICQPLTEKTLYPLVLW